MHLTLPDVGRRIELVYTPVRQDTLRGNPVSAVSDVIAPGKILFKLTKILPS